MAREYVKWTDEEDAKLLSMKAEGKSRDEMAAELKKSPDQCKGRLYYLQKVKGKYGVTDKAKTDTGEAEKAEVTTQVEQKGELNDLEKTMAETITEQEAEIDRLNGDVADLEGSLCLASDENTRLLDQIGTLTEKVASLESELADTKNALAQTETALDEEREAMRNVCADLEKAKEAESALTEMIEHAVADKEEYRKRLTAVDIKYEELSREFSEDTVEKNRRIADLEATIERYRNLIIVQAERIMRHES